MLPVLLALAGWVFGLGLLADLALELLEGER